jgi:hypothetical protein
VDTDKQLLATARDCFYFVTKFFEVIKLSAPHIYHSALELSPQSAIVRKLYHHHHSHTMPRVVRGVPRSWNQPLTIKTNHKFSTWSPCGKSLAVATPDDVEIWDVLTLGKHSTLQPANPSHKLWDISEQNIPEHSPDGIAYSPDGHFLACYSSSSAIIIIWEIQTGGVVNVIECGAIGTTLKSLVWSFDGKTIGAIFVGGQGWLVGVCDVTLGVMMSSGTLQSLCKPYLWPHDKSLRVLATSGYGQINFTIYEVGPALPRVKLFSIMLSTHSVPQTISFSPTTHHISIVTNEHTLLVFNNQNEEVLGQTNSFHGNCFSPDGSHLVVSGEDYVHVWQCQPTLYDLWRRIPFRHDSGHLPQGSRFSSTSLSMLILREGSLEVVHLDDLEANLPTDPICQYGKISTYGTYIVTADQGGHTITITNLHSQIPSQLIDVPCPIDGLALTGSILLVEGKHKVIAWRLTIEGAVDEAFGDKGVVSRDSSSKLEDRCYKTWSCGQKTCGAVGSLVTGDTGIIQFHDSHFVCYNTDTGECHESVPIQVPPPPTYQHNFTDNHSIHTLLQYHNFCERNDLPKDNQPASTPSYEEGWVKYPEGVHQYRFWLPAHWMANFEDDAYWFNDITTLWLHGSELVVIKF